MTIARTHELHRRRLSRNVGVAVSLVAFIVIVFGLTVAKVQRGGSLEAFDHSFRPDLADRTPGEDSR
jgi:hypothetical protein